KCSPYPAQIPDLYAQSHGVRPPSKTHPITGSLAIYSSAGADAQVVGSLQFPGLDLTDVVVVRDVAILASWDSGLIFVDVADPTSPSELLRIPFDQTLSNTPGSPHRMRLVGDLLFVSATSGSVYLVDVSDPRQPNVVSGGNTEAAYDAIPVGD